MTDIREKYPEIPTLLLSAICSCVGSHKLDVILQSYDEAKRWKDEKATDERVVVFIDLMGPETG